MVLLMFESYQNTGMRDLEIDNFEIGSMEAIRQYLASYIDEIERCYSGV